jgi:nucleoside-diphosphate-sugar epimerase
MHPHILQKYFCVFEAVDPSKPNVAQLPWGEVSTVEDAPPRSTATHTHFDRARGFTGRHFQKFAEDTGYDVYCSSADVRDYNELQKEVARCAPDYVVHLAGISTTQCSDAKVLMDVNVTGIVNVLRAPVETGVTPHNVLVPSSVLVYGANPESPVVETAPLVPMNEYTRSKVLMERAGSEFKDKLRIVIARPFNYTGCRQADTFLIPKLVQHFAKKTEAIDAGNLDVEVNSTTSGTFATCTCSCLNARRRQTA